MNNAFIVKKDGYILCIGHGDIGERVIESKYNEILSAIRNRPTPPSGFGYRLRADNLEYELVELPPAPEYEPTEADKAEAYDILLGGDSE